MGKNVELIGCNCDIKIVKNVNLLWVKNCTIKLGLKCQIKLVHKCQINMGKWENDNLKLFNWAKNVKLTWVKL